MSESKLKKAAELSLNDWNKRMDKAIKKEHIKTLRERSGMSQNNFAEYLNIPPSTLKKWEQGLRECPVYLIELIEYKLIKEKII